MTKEELKVGQTIAINFGYNNDIRGEFKITAIEGDDIYLDWDCYWFPIKNDERRNVEIVSA